MQLYLEAEKYAPKNARQLEDKILKLEAQYEKKRDELSTSKLIQLLDDLVQTCCELGDFRRAEKHNKALCEENELAYGRNHESTEKAYRLLAELQYNKLFKYKEAMRTQKTLVDIEASLLNEVKASNKSSKDTVRKQVFALSKALNTLGSMYKQNGMLQESLDTHTSAALSYESCFVMKRVPYQRQQGIYSRKEILEIRERDRKEIEGLVGTPLPKNAMSSKGAEGAEEDEDDLSQYEDIPDEISVVNEEKTDIPLDYVQALINKGNIQFEMEQYRACYHTLNEVKRLQFVFMENGTTEAYDALVKVYMTLGTACIRFYNGMDVSFEVLDSKAHEAEIIFKKAVEFAKMAFGDEDDRVASLLYSLGVLFSQRRQFDQSEDFTRQALAILEKRPIDDESMIFETEQMATEEVERRIMKQIGDNREMAIQNAEEMDIARMSRRWTEMAKCYLTLATLYLKVKKPVDDAQFQSFMKVAEGYYKRSLSIHNAIIRMFYGDKDKNSMSKSLKALKYDSAFILNALGLLHKKRGEKLEAIAMFEKALELGKSLVEPTADGEPISNYVVASSLLNLANYFLYTLREVDTAYQYYKESFEAYDSAFPHEFHVDVADVSLGMGKIELERNQVEEAKRNFEQASNILMAYSNMFDERIDEAHRLLHQASKRLAKKFSEEQDDIDSGKIVLTNDEMNQRMIKLEQEHNQDKENYAKWKMFETRREEERAMAMKK